MDPQRFDLLARRMAGEATRRQALRLLAGGALGLLAVLPGRAGADAQEEAAAACRKEGEFCKRGNQCCSGRCLGPRGKKTCRRAPRQSICTIRNRGADCGVGSSICTCRVTVAGASFCTNGSQVVCGDCASNAECVAQLGRGAVCIPENCSTGETSACVAPCSDPV